MQSSTSLQNKAPRLVSTTHYCVMGDVSVADGVAIAPGVVLQASSGSRIVIASGACLAGGVCIQSRKGVLTIGAGANLGANVLVVGKGEIGANACISPGSTIVNPQVSAEQLVPPNALLTSELTSKAAATAPSGFSAGSYAPSAGAYTAQNSFNSQSFSSQSFNSQKSNVQSFSSQASFSESSSQVTPQRENGTFSNTFVERPPVARAVPQITPQKENDTSVSTFVEPPPVGPKAIAIPDLSGQSGQYVDPSVQNNGVQLNNGPGSSASNSSALSVTTNNRVYGKDQVSQLLSTLFPNRAT